jgi:hypothetical protein
VAYLLPIIIPVGFAAFCYFSENFHFILETWVDVAKQRTIPSLHFAYETEVFMRSFGLFEIIIKLLTLVFFLGSIFYVWRSDRKLKNLKVHVKAPSESKWNKYLLNDI